MPAAWVVPVGDAGRDLDAGLSPRPESMAVDVLDLQGRVRRLGDGVGVSRR